MGRPEIGIDIFCGVCYGKGAGTQFDHSRVSAGSTENNDGCKIFRMNGKAAEPRVRGLLLLMPEDFLFSGGQTKK